MTFQLHSSIMNKTKHFAVIFADILNFREVQELNRRAAGQSEKPLCALTKESVRPPPPFSAREPSVRLSSQNIM